MIVGNTWYPDGNTAFTRGASSLTRKEAIEFANLVLAVANEAPVVQDTQVDLAQEVGVPTNAATYTVRRGPGRPKGSKNRRTIEREARQQARATAEVAAPTAHAVPAPPAADISDEIRESLRILGLDDKQIDVSLCRVGAV